MTTAHEEQVRQAQREEWGAAAAGWTTRRRDVASPSHAITERLLRAADIRAGQRALDMACGVGDPAFAIAEIVGPTGHVVGLDVTPAMIEGARAYAREQSIGNVEFRVIANELEIDAPPASFDAVTCRHGLMYMPDPVAAVRVWGAALKPGARLAFSTWGPPERVPFFMTVMQIIMRHVTLPAPAPKDPSPFAIPTAEAQAAILNAAGFTDVRTEVFQTSAMEATSATDWWEIVATTAGPIVTLLASLPPEARQAIRQDGIETITQRFPDGQIKLGGEALVASGAKPR